MLNNTCITVTVLVAEVSKIIRSYFGYHRKSPIVLAAAVMMTIISNCIDVTVV